MFYCQVWQMSPSNWRIVGVRPKRGNRKSWTVPQDLASRPFPANAHQRLCSWHSPCSGSYNRCKLFLRD